MTRNLSATLKKLASHRLAGVADSSWLKLQRDMLRMQIVNTVHIKKESPDFVVSSPTLKHRIKTFLAWYVFRGNPWAIAVRVTAMILIVVLVPFTGWVTTVNAALLSVPGDALYGLKIASEKMQITLTSDKPTQIKLRTEFASRRADEVVRLSARENTAPHIKKAVERLSQEIKTVERSLEELSKENPSVDTVVDVARNVDVKTEEIVKVLNKTGVLSQAAPEIHEVKALVDTVSVKAAETLVKTKSDVAAQISDAEIKQTLEEKIKRAESTLDQVEQALITTTSTIAALPDRQATELHSKVEEQVKIAKDVVAKATDSLKSQRFEEAIDKVKEVKTLVTETEKLLATATQNALSSSAIPSAEAQLPSTTLKFVHGSSSTPRVLNPSIEMKTQLDEAPVSGVVERMILAEEQLKKIEEP